MLSISSIDWDIKHYAWDTQSGSACSVQGPVTCHACRIVGPIGSAARPAQPDRVHLRAWLVRLAGYEDVAFEDDAVRPAVVTGTVAGALAFIPAYGSAPDAEGPGGPG